MAKNTNKIEQFYLQSKTKIRLLVLYQAPLIS